MKQIELNINGNGTCDDWLDGFEKIELLHNAIQNDILTENSQVQGTLTTPIAPPKKTASIKEKFPDFNVEVDDTLVQFEDKEVCKVFANKANNGSPVTESIIGNITSVNGWFNNNQNIKELDLCKTKIEKIDYSNFQGCINIEKVIFPSTIKTLTQVFNGLSCTSLDLTGSNNTFVTDLTGTFYTCTCDFIDAKSLNTDNCTSFNTCFRQANVKSIDIRGWKAYNVTRPNQMFYRCTATTLIGGSQSLDEVVLEGLGTKCSLDIYFINDNNLDRPSMRAIINGLADLSGLDAKTICFAGAKSRLTQEDIDIAESKNWIVT